MADWTPEERNDGGVILGWYQTGYSEDVPYRTVEGPVGEVKCTELLDRTPFGNHLTGSVTYEQDANGVASLVLGTAGEYLSHNSPYLLGTDWQQVRSQDMTYFAVTRHPQHDQGRYFFSESSTLDDAVFKPMQLGGDAGSTVATQITHSLTDKAGVIRAQLAPSGECSAGGVDKRHVHCVTYVAGRTNVLNPEVNASWNGYLSPSFTYLNTGAENYEVVELRDNPAATPWWPKNGNWQGSGDRFTIGGVINGDGVSTQTSEYRLYALIIVRDCTKNLRQLIEQYLAHYYGIGDSLDPTHIGAGGPIQAEPDDDPLFSTVRLYNQFKGPPGQQWSQDAIVDQGFQFGVDPDEYSAEAYWYLDNGDHPYEYLPDDAVAAGLDIRNSIYWWFNEGFDEYQLPFVDFDISLNNPIFPYRMAGAIPYGALYPRPLSSGSTAWWGGIHSAKVEYPVIPSIRFGDFEPQRQQQPMFTGTNIDPIRTSDFCIELTVMPFGPSCDEDHGILAIGEVARDGTGDGKLRVGFQEYDRRWYVFNDMGYESTSDFLGLQYMSWIVPENEPFRRPYDLCIQRRNNKLELWLDGVKRGEALKALEPGAVSRVDYDILDTFRRLNNPQLPDYDPTKELNSIKFVDGLGICIGPNHVTEAPNALYVGGRTNGFSGVSADIYETCGAFMIDDFRYTATARYTDSYNPSAKVFAPVLPFFSTNPVDLYVYEGADVSFTVEATTTEGTLTYQWYDGNTDNPLIGETSTVLSLFNVPFVYPYATYYCIADNGQAKARSATATLYAQPNVITGIARGGELPEAPQGVGQNTRVVFAECNGMPPEPTAVQAQTIAGQGPLPSPLYPPGIVATVAYDDLYTAVGDNYLGELIDADGNVTTVPISSWQATLSNSNSNYCQMVVPNAAPYNDALASAVEFRVVRVRSVQGLEARLTMAQVAADTVTNARGLSKNTATISGYSEAYGEDAATTIPRELQGVRSFSSGGTGLRIRCEIDELVKPGRRVTWLTDADFTCGFVNLYVNGNQAYMDVGE